MKITIRMDSNGIVPLSETETAETSIIGAKHIKMDLDKVQDTPFREGLRQLLLDQQRKAS